MPDEPTEWRPQRWPRHLAVAFASALAVLTLGGVIFVLSPNPDASDPEPPAGIVRIEAAQAVMVQHLVPDDGATDANDDLVASVSIRTLRAQENGSFKATFGSGVLIDRGTVLTAAHVLPVTDAPITVSCRSTDSDARVVHADRLRDVAVLEAADCPGTRRRIATAVPMPDTPLIAIGFDYSHDGVAGTFAAQTVARTSLCEGAVPLKSVSPSCSCKPSCKAANDIIDAWKANDVPLPYAVTGVRKPGWSGAPIFDREGAIVGIITLGSEDLNRTYVVRPEVIAGVLHDAGI